MQKRSITANPKNMKLTKYLFFIFAVFFFQKKVHSQNSISFNFNDSTKNWHVEKGHVEILENGAHKGKAMKLYDNTSVFFEMNLQPASTYKVVAWLRTESGADNITLQVNHLGKNNISINSALATWTKTESYFNVSANQQKAYLEFDFGNSQGNTAAWIDEITITRISDYSEKKYTGIPPVPHREVKEEGGIQMQPDEKMQWMLDAKLGMFIHWGLYAGPAQGEWYMENKGIAIDDYRKLAYPESGDQYFDAKDFDAKKWVSLAKKVGMRYMNMVTEHHDGYALFNSHYVNAFTSKQTHNRDFVKEYVEACRNAGLKVGIYKTLINWRYPGYYDITGTDCKPNKFGYTTQAWHKENARMMKEELYCQVKELMTNYGKLDQLFWDGGWLGQQGSDADASYFWEPGKYLSNTNQWPVRDCFQDKEDATGKPLGLMGIVRKYQPDILVNPRSGWIGDYTCEEGSGPVKGDVRSGVVEKCISIAPGWGYTKQMENPQRIMPLANLKKIFADCIVRNMCLLINVGPNKHGDIPSLVEQRLLELGSWVNENAAAIYGTRGGPLNPVDDQYGYCYKGNTIYIYLLGSYTNPNFVLPPVNKGMKIIKAYNVSTGEYINSKQHAQEITLKNIKAQKGDIQVIAVELNKNIE
ncbi:MAG: alpha-L-fucosidase [Bacteroidota bacterium]|nr:alpha-L-fucosidase [Bacteroidota bacterium]